MCSRYSWLLARIFAKLGPSKNALVRSTAVPTFVQMGVASNVVPAHTDITVDMRTLPGSTAASTMEDIVKMMAAALYAPEESEPGVPSLTPNSTLAFTGRNLLWVCISRS